ECSRRNSVEQVHASGPPIAAWRSDHEITQATDSRVEITGTTDRVACHVGAGSDKDRTLRRRRVCRRRRDLQPAEIHDSVQLPTGQRGAAINQVSRSGLASEIRRSDEQVVDPPGGPVNVAGTGDRGPGSIATIGTRECELRLCLDQLEVERTSRVRKARWLEDKNAAVTGLAVERGARFADDQVRTAVA